jgi:pyruvate formate lyase activating enzyme
MAGGLTVSGGEPLMQRSFVMKLIAAARGMGIHTAIETNGYLGSELSDSELDSIDLVLLGIKAWGAERHRDLTGRDPEPTLEFARRLAARRQPIWVRFVLVPGLTDDPDEIAGIARFAAGLGNVQRVEVLPFHQLGKFKWDQLGMRYRLADARPPTPEEAATACEIFRKEGLLAV